MKLRANHDRYQVLEHVAIFSSNDRIFARDSFIPYGSFDKKIGTLLPELVFRHNVWAEIVSMLVMILVAHGLLIISLEYEIFVEMRGMKGDSLIDYWPIYGLFFFCLIPALLFIKKYCDIRYLLFRGDQVIFQSRAYGRRIYDVEDLQFHFIKLLYSEDRYQLEVELPDESIPENRRLLILETAVGRRTIDGIMAVLFPLIQGDDGPFKSAKKRHFQAERDDGKKSLWDKFWNIDAHIHVWFLNYKINQVLFWIVHGSAKKIFEKEAAMKGG